MVSPPARGPGRGMICNLHTEYHKQYSDLFAIDKEGVDIREVVVMLKLGKGI